MNSRYSGVPGKSVLSATTTALGARMFVSRMTLMSGRYMSFQWSSRTKSTLRGFFAAISRMESLVGRRDNQAATRRDCVDGDCPRRNKDFLPKVNQPPHRPRTQQAPRKPRPV